MCPTFNEFQEQHNYVLGKVQKSHFLELLAHNYIQKLLFCHYLDFCFNLLKDLIIAWKKISAARAVRNLHKIMILRKYFKLRLGLLSLNSEQS